MVDKTRRQLMMTTLSLMGLTACRRAGMPHSWDDNSNSVASVKMPQKPNLSSRWSNGGRSNGDDWEMPIISGISGDYGQGNIITLTGKFTAKRNGQMYYHTGDSSKEGELADFLENFSGGHDTGSGIRAYRHDSTRSFSKGGTSFHANWGNHQQSGIENQCIFFADAPQQEIFVSLEYWLDLSVVDTSKYAGPQVKFARILASDSRHFTTPEMVPHIQYHENNTPSGIGGRMLLAEAGAGGYGNRFVEPETGNTWGRGDTFYMSRNWNRLMFLFRLPSAVGKSDGRRWARTLEHATGRQIIGRDDGTWTYAGNPPANRFSFYAPKVTNHPDQGTADWQGPLTRVALPFFQLGYPNLDAWVDCIYINDSAERVELGNASTMEACTKLVVQNQISRANGQIQFEVEEGNLASDDDVYVFVVNSDTRYTTGTRIDMGGGA